MQTYMAHIYLNDVWKRVRPYIGRVTNLGKIPENALLTSSGEPYLTSNKEFILVAEGDTNLTPVSTNDYILNEGSFQYLPYIRKV